MKAFVGRSPAVRFLEAWLGLPAPDPLRRAAHACALLVVLVFLCLPLFRGLGRSDLDGDEAIYASVVDRMLETGRWLTPDYEGAPFFEKPPLKFWMVAAGMRAGILPHTEAGYRALDALFGAASFVYVYLLGRLVCGPLCGAFAAFFLAIHEELVFVHGLRSHDMDSMLVLSCCGGIYHFLRWAEGARPWPHVLAVVLFFAFGFLAKFAAALFLPLVLLVAVLLAPAWRARARADWRRWTAAALAAAALCAPWFVYHAVRYGEDFWAFLLSVHVWRRLTGQLDPSHLQPWWFYVGRICESFAKLWYYPVVGGALWVARTVRDRWPTGLLVLLWLAVPIAVLSVSRSKLYHYAYPFLPPIALFAGYAVAVAARVAYRWLNRIPGERLARGTPRIALGVLAVLCLLLALVTALRGTLRWELGPIVLRNASPLRPLAVAGLAALALRGRAAAAAGMLLAVGLWLDVAREHHRFLERTERGGRLLSTLAACLRSRQAGGPGVYVHFPEGKDLVHEVRYYFRPLGLRQPPLDPQRLERRLRHPAVLSPALVVVTEWPELARRLSSWPAEERTSLGIVGMPRYDLYLVLPGRFAACAGAVRGAGG
ncbi:MAG TPA: phospholipid carrier-dependent glycosyltransferase [Vicinamibacteria bacterium]